MLKPLVTLLLVGLAPLAAFAEKPNVIVIMADDLGYSDVGFNGCEDIPTPNIDTLAAEGVKFTSAYVTYPVCGPSRAGFMTGRYQQRFGFERNPQFRRGDPNMGLPVSEETMATILGKAGYTSGIIGKWHLGAHDVLHPLERGFDFFFGHLGGGHHYFQDMLTIPQNAKDEVESYKTWILRNHEPVKIDQYLTDAFSDEAVRFIENNQENPFFLFLSYNAPHTPLQAPEAVIDKFSNIKNPKRRTYAAMVSVLDEGVGRVLGKLKELDLEKETLVFFLSDNGGPTSANGSNNKPLRGAKSDVWEGGWRVPFVLRWSGEIEAGKTFDEPVSSMDILGTMAALAEVPIAEDRPLDGVNLIPFLKDEQPESPHEVVYLRKFDQQRYAVRKGDFKLVIPGKDGPRRLFNLERDIGEQRDLSDWNTGKLEELDQLRLQWDGQLMEPRFLGLIHTDAWKKPSKKKKD